MTTTLIILAHPEPRSFNGQWAKATETAELNLRHEVHWSDLCAMGFDPVERKSHYHKAEDEIFDPLKAQEAAKTGAPLPKDVALEVEKVRQADRLVFHFPMWWFAPPAILKGWCDRVLAHGVLHDVDNRFDTGLCKGKKAMFCVTTGASSAETAFNGKEGDVNMLIWPLAYTLRYLGMTVLEPVFVHGVHGYFEGEEKQDLQRRLREVLQNQSRLISAFDKRPEMIFNSDSDFDEKGSLKPEADCYSQFIRHEP